MGMTGRPHKPGGNTMATTLIGNAMFLALVVACIYALTLKDD